MPFILLVAPDNAGDRMRQSAGDSPAQDPQQGVESDPAKSVRSSFTNIRLFPSETIDQTELSVAVNPQDHNKLLVGCNATLVLVDSFSHETERHYTQGFFHSESGGATWEGGDTLPETVVGYYDPAVGYDADGNTFFNFTGINPYRVFIKRSLSPSNGATWGSRVLVRDGSEREDKNHMAIDLSSGPYRNNIYVAWTAFNTSFDCQTTPWDVWLARSRDRGINFSPIPVNLSAGTADYYSDGVNIAVGGDGTTYAVWAVYDKPGGECGTRVESWLGFNKSLDGCSTFVGAQRLPFPIHGIWGRLPVKGVRVRSFPSMAIDTTVPAPGILYIVWADSRNGNSDIYLTRSFNGGGSWDLPRRVNDDSSSSHQGDQWFPWVNVDPYGGVNVVFYDCRNDTNNRFTEAFVARSTDSGVHFTNTRVSEVAFDPTPLPGSDYMGDYIGITSSSNYIYPCWSDNRHRPVGWTRGIYQAFTAVIPTIPSVAPQYITQDEVWQFSKELRGDVIIAPGATVTVKSGTKVVASAFQDQWSSGLDTGLVELIVRGNLVLEGGTDRPTFMSNMGDTAVPGAWYGIRIDPFGSVTLGNGCIVLDGVNGLTIANGAVGAVQGVRIENCLNAGIRTSSSAVPILNDTIVGITPGYGIYIDHADPLVKECLIDSCEFGVYSFLSSARIRETVIDGPGTYGIYVASGALYDDIDSLRLVRDSVKGYFSGAHLSVNVINHCWVDSCDFISSTVGQRSPYGVKAGFASNVWMRRSKMKDFTTTGFDSFRSRSDLGKLKVENNNVADNGNNWIDADSAGCAPCNPRRIVHVGTASDTLHAHWNWWGADPPLASWFSGIVHYTSWHTGPPTFKVVPPEDPDIASTPNEFSFGQNYPNPFNTSTAIEFELWQSMEVNIDVFNILGQKVKVLVGRVFPAGRHRIEWNGTNDEDAALASGLYLYRIRTADHVETKKMVLLR